MCRRLVRDLHSNRSVWSFPLLSVALCALCLMALGCIWPSEPGFAPDAKVNFLPFIVWESASPSFTTVLSVSKTGERPAYSLVVGDPDLDQHLRVRFCYAKDTDFSALDWLDEEFAESDATAPSPDGVRPRVSSQPLLLCSRNDGPGPHYLVVVVTDGAFHFQGQGCEPMPGAASAMAAWEYTCTD
jgi:hypothetical protein